MYRYDEFDAKMVRERAEQFRYQVERRIKGELTEDEVQGRQKKLFALLDKNDDGKIEKSEMRGMAGRHGGWRHRGGWGHHGPNGGDVE